VAHTPDASRDDGDSQLAKPQPAASGLTSLDGSFAVNEFGETVSFRSGHATDKGGEERLEEPVERAETPSTVGRYRIDSVLGEGGSEPCIAVTTIS